jgi:hypothetical protein
MGDPVLGHQLQFFFSDLRIWDHDNIPLFLERRGVAGASFKFRPLSLGSLHGFISRPDIQAWSKQGSLLKGAGGVTVT